MKNEKYSPARGPNKNSLDTRFKANLISSPGVNIEYMTENMTVHRYDINYACACD